jgi:hypothetical protein
MSADDIRGAGPLADAGNEPSPEDDEDGGADGSELGGRVLDLYRRYIGPPERAADAYLGFALFFAGVAMGVVGLALFLVDGLAGDEPLFWLRSVAFSVGSLGLPTLLLGVTVLLPVDRRARLAALGGLAVCLAAVALFLAVYPGSWNVATGPDYSTLGVSVYAVGLVTVVGAAGAALVAYHISQTASPRPAAAEPEHEDEAAESETRTEAQVQRDIEEAMSGAELTWGGVHRDESRRIDIVSDDSFDLDAEEVTPEKVRSTDTVDDAVAGLSRLQGGAERTGRGGGTDEQAAALQDLRERRQSDDEAEETSWWEWIRSAFTRR